MRWGVCVDLRQPVVVAEDVDPRVRGEAGEDVADRGRAVALGAAGTEDGRQDRRDEGVSG